MKARIILAIAAIVLGSSVGAPARASTIIQPEVRAQLERATGPISVLVTADTTAGADRAVDAAGMTLIEAFPRIGVVAATGSAESIRLLHGRPGVRRVDANPSLEMYDDVAHRATGLAALRDGASASGLAALRRANGSAYDGSGVSIAVVDTGFDSTHEQFVQAGGAKFDVHLRQACVFHREFATWAAGVDLPPDCSAWINAPAGDSDNDEGHGTIVAASAAGYSRTTATGRPVSGVAPGARLVGLSIGTGPAMYNALSAFNWILEHHHDPCGDGTCAPVRVVNASWGLASDDDVFTRRPDPQSPMSLMTRALVHAGVVVVFAAGNDGGNGSNAQTNFFGLSPVPGALLVGAYDDANAGDRDFMIAGFSARGKIGERGTYPDLVAPGVSFAAACAPATDLCSLGPGLEGPYGSFSGTSISAPYVAGAVAILLEADPTLTPAEIEDILEDTASSLGAPGHYEPDSYVDAQGHSRGNADHATSFDVGHGKLDLVAALARALRRGAHAWPDPCAPASSVILTDTAGDARALYQEIPIDQPDLDVVEATADLEAVPGALKVVVTYADVPEVAVTPMHTTVKVVLDRGGALDPNGGAGGEVDLERTAAGDLFSVNQGNITAEGTVDPAANTVTFVIRPADGPVTARATLTWIWTSTRFNGFIADADTTDGACSVRA